MNNSCWAIYVDVEGFSSIFKQNRVHAIEILNNLMEDIYIIGYEIYNNEYKRLFVNQIADGFIITSFVANDIFRPVNISVALMRSALEVPGFLRIAIAFGSKGDIASCYPDIIQKVIEESQSNNTIPLGDGIMTIFTSMGSAFINTNEIMKKGPKGPLIMMDDSYYECLEDDEDIIFLHKNDIYSVDWINTNNNEIKTILNKICNEAIKVEWCKYKVQEYIKKFKPEKDWRVNLDRMLNKEFS